jgi:hypothetical protein
MDADKPILFNPRLSVFIGGRPCFGFFQQPLRAAAGKIASPTICAEY